MTVPAHVRAALIRASLLCAIAAPVIYFGTQIAAQSLTPGYDWREQLASELGTAGSPAAVLFNMGMVAAGLATLMGLPGFYAGLGAISAFRTRWIVLLCLLASGGATLWAGAHPLPSPLHDPGFIPLLGIICLPAALALACREARVAPVAGAYFLLSSIAAALLLATSGFGLAAEAPGCFQRLAAAMVYPPVAVAGIILMRAPRPR